MNEEMKMTKSNLIATIGKMEQQKESFEEFSIDVWIADCPELLQRSSDGSTGAGQKGV
jgi:hypothetical protein